MAEDDEIDVLGDFSLDNILLKGETGMFDNASLVSQNSDLLNCDYTIHPQWLLDKPSTNPALWYNSSTDTDLDADLARQFELESQSNISTENSITDESGWTEKEKTLLNRGIEIFGKNNFNLSQFIGSRTPAEVKYFFKNFHSDVELTYSTVNENVLFDEHCIQETVITSCNNTNNYVLNDDEIPASIEEIIAAVSTATPTVPNIKRRKSTKSNCSSSDSLLNYENIPSGQSLLKSNYFIKEPTASMSPSKSKENKKRDQRRNSAQKKAHENSTKSAKFKFKTKLFMAYKNVLNQTNGNKKSTHSSYPNNRKRRQKNNNRKSSVSASLSESDTTHSEASDVQIVTGNGLCVPLSQGEEVIKIRKENETTDTDSDVEIDIEDTDDETSLGPPPATFISAVVPSSAETTKTATNNNSLVVDETNENKTIVETKSQSTKTCDTDIVKPIAKKIPQLEDLGKEVVDALMSLEYPTRETELAPNEISEVEKFIFYEFFEGRPTKTPARYLKIRNHILGAWKSIRPNYVTKTSIRQGLKQAGDVNCIGRIHNYLEQIAAVNFGCSLTNYMRPLHDLAQVVPTPKERAVVPVEPMVRSKFESQSRPRNKKKYVNDGEGGCTLTHDERGDIINTTVINEEPAVKQRPYIKKPTIRLIYCRAFTEMKQQEYVVRLDLSVLLLMDLHAHMYMTEVMGLVGGHWDDVGRVLSVSRYEPCTNIAPSSTHCDMCPISQARAAEIFHNEALDILGWYHSHPTFAPEPSQQDLDTQMHVQQWIGHNRPCIGVILSPFSLNGALIASPYRCLIVDKKEHFEDQFVPYKFKVDLIAEHMDVPQLLSHASSIVAHEAALKPAAAAPSAGSSSKIQFTHPYFQDHSITHLDKYIYSIKMHLAKCSGITKLTCDAIVRGLSEMCTRINR